MSRPDMPNDWHQLAPLIDAVLDAAPVQRPALLDELSGGDAARRAELERLVADCERADPLLDRPAAERFAGLLEDEAVALPEMLGERYRIVKELGRGGMAVVYLARDEKHGRDVAVKVVRPDLAAVVGGARFLREIEIAARLHHPHIVPLYDSGEIGGILYYVMPYQEGHSLRERLEREGALPIDDAVMILRDVCDALTHAHQHGIVHRDIKPGNVLLSGRHATVTDFGVAKAVSEARGPAALTTAGVALGTPMYMAPEQVAADPQIDHRADIYAVGVLAYEMLAGRPPFGAESQQVLSDHLIRVPENLSVHRPSLPPALVELVMKCLEKRPADRWQSADELLSRLETLSRLQGGLGEESKPIPAGTARSPRRSDLKEGARPRVARVVLGLTVAAVLIAGVWLLRVGGSRGTTQRPSATLDGNARRTTLIAVLPFENLGPADDEYFAAGMTDEITSRLGALSGLGLVPRRAAQRYARTDMTMREIGRELGIDYLLVGSVRWAAPGTGSRSVRITVELVRAQDERQLWSTAYDRVIDDIFQVQSDIAGQVIERLGVTVREGERGRLSAKPTENHQAYTLYLKGRYYWNKRTEQNIQIGLDYFQQAVDLDPGYSRAWVGIADTWIFRGWYSRLAPRETFPKAKGAALRALQFDSTLAEAHASMGHIHLEFDYNWEAAEREYRRAIELDSTYAIAHHWYGGFLSAMGRHDEALRQAETARTLDPLSLIIQTWVGLRYYFAGRYEDAIREYGKALELDRDFAPAHWHLGWAYLQTGRFEEGISEAQRALALDEGNLLYLASLGHAYARAGRGKDARATLARLAQASTTRHVSAYHLAAIYVALGDTNPGLDGLERAFDERSPWIGYLGVDPRLEPLRSHPRFERLLEKARLRF